MITTPRAQRGTSEHAATAAVPRVARALRPCVVGRGHLVHAPVVEMELFLAVVPSAADMNSLFVEFVRDGYHPAEWILEDDNGAFVYCYTTVGEQIVWPSAEFKHRVSNRLGHDVRTVLSLKSGPTTGSESLLRMIAARVSARWSAVRDGDE